MLPLLALGAIYAQPQQVPYGPCTDTASCEAHYKMDSPLPFYQCLEPTMPGTGKEHHSMCGPLCDCENLCPTHPNTCKKTCTYSFHDKLSKPGKNNHLAKQAFVCAGNLQTQIYTWPPDATKEQMTSSFSRIELFDGDENDYVGYDPAFDPEDPGDVLDQNVFCPKSFAPDGVIPGWVTNTSAAGSVAGATAAWKYDTAATQGAWTAPAADYYCYGAPKNVKADCTFFEDDNEFEQEGMRFAFQTCKCDGWVVQDLAIADNKGVHLAAPPLIIPLINCPQKEKVCFYPNLKPLFPSYCTAPGPGPPGGGKKKKKSSHAGLAAGLVIAILAGAAIAGLWYRNKQANAPVSTLGQSLTDVQYKQEIGSGMATTGL